MAQRGMLPLPSGDAQRTARRMPVWTQRGVLFVVGSLLAVTFPIGQYAATAHGPEPVPAPQARVLIPFTPTAAPDQAPVVDVVRQDQVTVTTPAATTLVAPTPEAASSLPSQPVDASTRTQDTVEPTVTPQEPLMAVASQSDVLMTPGAPVDAQDGAQSLAQALHDGTVHIAPPPSAPDGPPAAAVVAVAVAPTATADDRDGAQSQARVMHDAGPELRTAQEQLATALDALGPPSGGSAADEAAKKLFVNDKITDLSKVPDAQWIEWPAYTPAPHRTPVPTLKGSGQFIWPVQGWISTAYGPTHLAIDIAAMSGSPEVAADGGTVVFAGPDYGGLGIALSIDHGNGFVTTYGHQLDIVVKEGDVVSRGQLVGHVGSTGHSSGPHVHFVVKKNGSTVNPLGYLNGNTGVGPKPQVTVPDFTNLPPVKAQQLAQVYHLVVKVQGEDSTTAAVATGNLFGQSPEPNTQAAVDTVVLVKTSLGTPTPTPTITSTPTVVAISTVTATPTATQRAGAPTRQTTPAEPGITPSAPERSGSTLSQAEPTSSVVSPQPSPATATQAASTVTPVAPPAPATATALATQPPPTPRPSVAPTQVPPVTVPTLVATAAPVTPKSTATTAKK